MSQDNLRTSEDKVRVLEPIFEADPPRSGALLEHDPLRADGIE